MRSEHGVAVRLGEVAVVALLAGAVFVVHDAEYMLSHPLWLDESWVAISTRAPLSELPRVTAVTPLGWTLLLRAVPVPGEQSLRLLPLAFSAATAVAAYMLGRELRLVGRLGTGAITAGAALLVPAMLVRNDLKPYTADAFVAVLLLLLVARLETMWSRRRLVAVGVAAFSGMLISHTAAFAGAAALSAVAFAAIATRSARRLSESLLVATGTAAGMGALYLIVDRRHVNPSLVDYWRGYYLPLDHGLSGMADFVRLRTYEVLPHVGVGVPELLLLSGAAVVTLLVTGQRVATALTVPLMVPLVAIASALRRYPFLELRTSTFLLVAMAVFLAVGAAGVGRLLARAHVFAGVAFVGLAASSCLHATSPYVRTHTLPNEDIRSQVRYVAAHRRAGDVVLLSSSALYGFAYYSPRLPITFHSTPAFATGFTLLPSAAGLVLLRGRERSDVRRGMQRAATLACQTSDSRVWIIRTHLTAREARAFAEQLQGRQVEVLRVGAEPLLRQTPACA